MSLQSCPTLCVPIDGSPPGSPVPGILQARTLEWVAISSSNAWKWKVNVKSLSLVQPSATPWTIAYQAPPSMGFSKQEYWRSMNQGKLELVKQEMARVNVDILGISELKWTGMGEFNSDDHYIYYCGQESLRRNGVVIMVSKRVRNAVLGYNLQNDRMISVSLYWILIIKL